MIEEQLEHENFEESIDSEKPIESYGILDLDYSDSALENNEPELCGKIVNALDRAWCYSDIALEYDRPELCEEITDELEKDWCYSDVAEKFENM